jgi:hypothetical protein
MKKNRNIEVSEEIEIVGLEQVEIAKIFALSDSNSMSPDVRDLMEAISNASEEFEATGLSKTNSHQKYAYATIQDICNAVTPALRKNKVRVIHYADKDLLYTRLIHYPTGQWCQDVRMMENEKPGNQGKGSAQTYMRKYALLALCGIAPEEDDDGAKEQQYIESKPQEKIDLITKEQAKELVNLIYSLIADKDKAKRIYDHLLVMYEVKGFGMLQAREFDEVKEHIKNICSN